MNLKINKILFCSLVVTIVAAEGAYAQTEGIAAKDSLDQAVVSALKIGSKISEIPSEVNIITSLDVKKHPSLSISDVLEKEAGLSKGGDGIWATDINVRGLSGNRLVILVDRNRVETATDLTASLSMLNVNDIDHVEVVKGAQSSIYGSGAIGGIINIVTKDGHFAENPYFAGNFTANYSSMNNGHGEYLALYGGSRKWYVKFNAAFAQGGDARTPKGMMKNSGYNSADISAAAALKTSDNQRLKLLFQRNFSWNVGIPGGASFTADATATYKDINRTLVCLNYDADRLTQTMTHLNAKAFYQGINRDVEMQPNIPKPVSGAVPAKVTPFAWHHTFGASAEARWQFGQWNNLTAGAEMWQRNITSNRKKYIEQYSDGILTTEMIRTETPLPEASYTSAGIFAQDEMKFIDGRLILSLGGRIDMNYVKNKEVYNVESVKNVTTGTVNPNPPGKFVTFAASGRADPSWSANAGVLFKAGRKTDLTLNLSRSYRSPALEELYKFIDLSGNRIHFGNPQLKAEKGIGGDIGVRLHGERLNLRMSAYACLINDMIVERKANVSPQSVNDTLVLTNASRALLYGFDCDISYEFIKGLKAYAAGGGTIGHELSAQNAWLPMIPPLNARAGICYENSRILGVNLDVIACGARKCGHIAEGERATDGWWRLDFAIHSPIISLKHCNLQIFGGIDNITDNVYTNFLATNRGNIVCEPGRNIFLRLNLSL